MRKRIRKILITGGAGFIGSEFVRQAAKGGLEVTVIDKLTYAGDLRRLKGVPLRFYKADICDEKAIDSIIKRQNPDTIVNFAAESHVDRSIIKPQDFITTNVTGTQVLLDTAKKHGVGLFCQISTDEIYGDIKKGEFTEGSPLNPSSPYAVSKAAADLLISSYIRTYAMPAIIVRPSNNYGPWQYPEKLIPLAILKILRKEKVPIYAQGKNVREWLYVEDCARGILQILRKGKAGSTYNLGSGQEMQNIEAIRLLLKEMKMSPSSIEFVKDRPGHDVRYRLNCEKVRDEIGWHPKVKFKEGIKYTVEWAVLHKDWLLSKWPGISWLYRKR
jgi:dTDP-glucose 4,6-dehydratase